MGFLTGKTAVITGAGRAVLSNGRCGSIGYGIATAYAKEGANIVITGRNVKKLEDARAEGRLGFEYGITRMPWISEELKSRSMSVTNVVAINGYSRHKELANRFAAYLTEECADYLYGRTGKISANLRTDQDDTLLQVFKAEYADSVPLPKMMETSNFWMQLEGLFSKVWNGADVTALIQELAAQIAMQTEGLPQ